ncbi:MAG TPA: hypothetical protein VFM35_04295 [Candidatus Binatia bacterium]|nr:hypothetical protein [Candidatus Binatia bacterium]
MTFRNKIYVTIFAILEFIAVLFFLGLAARAAEAADNVAGQQIVTGPEQHALSLVSFDPWVVEGEVVGALVAYVYDDVTTERPADYWELYDKEGNLLALSWFDRFGIKRTAIDRGIVEQGDELEGVFVMVADGDLI